LAIGKPMWFVPVYFILAIVVATLLGDLVAKGYSDRMNAWLRRQWGERKLGSAIEMETSAAGTDAIPAGR